MSRSPTRRAALAAPFALAACGQAIGARPLRSAEAHPADYPTTRAVERMSELLSQRTDGRLRIRIYSGGQLGEEKDTLEITIFGGLDINRINLAPLNTIAPETLAPSLPFIFSDTAHMRRALDGAPGEAVLESLAPHGLIGLCFYDSGARSFYNKRRPIHTPADMRGMKIRVQNSDLYVSLVEALGANATPMPYGEVYQALVQGVIDGAENNWPSFDSSRHFEVARHYSLTQHLMTPEVLVMSRRAWAALSAADRDLVRAAARESVPYMRTLWDAREAEAEARIRASGLDVVEEIDREAFQRATAPVWRKMLTTARQHAIVEAMQAA